MTSDEPRFATTSVSHVFVMEWAAILRDMAVGLFIAGAIAAWVPDSFWRTFFFTGHPLAARLWGPRTGGLAMVRMMGGSPDEGHADQAP